MAAAPKLVLHPVAIGTGDMQRNSGVDGVLYSLSEMYIRTLFFYKNGRISTPQARQKLSVTRSKDMDEMYCFYKPGLEK